jgi:phage shock protein C
MKGRLYRSRTEVMLGGVCGGMGQYLGVDPTLVRLIFVFLTISGVGLLLYLAMWVIVPREERGDLSVAGTPEAGTAELAEGMRTQGEQPRGTASGSSSQGGVLAGGVLILLGLVFLVQNLHISWLRWINIDVVWPLLLIFGGLLLIQRRVK